MGTVYALKVNENNIDKKLLEGMKFLGRNLIDETIKSKNEKEYADNLKIALDKCLISPYELWFRARESEGSKIERKVLTISIAGKKITLELDGGDSLKIEVEIEDTRDKPNKTVYKMKTVFPEIVDRQNYDYLFSAAKDIRSYADVDEAQSYLAAFKFLSRCA